VVQRGSMIAMDGTIYIVTGLQLNSHHRPTYNDGVPRDAVDKQLDLYYCDTRSGHLTSCLLLFSALDFSHNITHLENTITNVAA